MSRSSSSSSSSSSAWTSPAPSVSPSVTMQPSPSPVVDDNSRKQIAQISLASPSPSPPPTTLPLPPPPQVVVASPPLMSEPPLTSPDPLPPPASSTQPIISPPPAPSSPISTTPYSPPPPPPSVTATSIAPSPLPPQPPTRLAPPPLSPPPLLPEISPPISALTPETSSPPPPDVPISRPTLSSPPPSSASASLPSTPKISPPPTSVLAPPLTKPSKSPLPQVLTSPPPPPTAPQAPKYLTSLPSPHSLVDRSLHAKPGTGQLRITTVLVVGCIIGAILLVLIALGLLICCCKYRWKKKRGPVEEGFYKSACLAQNDNSHAVIPQYPQDNVLLPRAQMFKVVPNPCPQPPRMRSRGGGSGSISSGSENPIPPQAPSVALYFSSGTFTYDQLVVATNGFSEANLLGQGGFGYVHKGVLPSGQEIAVKQLKTDSHQGEREFQAEVETVSRVHHKHLVSLVGYCITGAERLLIYEFVPNKTLDFHLHGKEQPVIDWAARMKIAIGSAKGLAYLHEDCNPTIIHRDIKASNILLDFRFQAKVSDFGLAKIFSDTSTSSISHISTRVVGTFGYLAPEYASSGKVTDKSDVYSYGVMLLELITGRPPISKTESSSSGGLVDSTRPLLSQALEDGNFNALADPRLLSNYNNSEMARMVACAAACVRHSAWLRPRMSQVVHALEGHVSLTDIDQGMLPGQSTLYASSGSSNFDAHKCMKFNETMENQEYGLSRFSESTSEYGVNPSGSSSEFQQIT